MLKLYNSYTKRKEVFRPLKGKRVAMYNCGPTVYDFVHIGNLRSFLLADVLRRYLEYRGYQVYQIMNITDVGHMTNDAEAGEDKMSVAMRREGKGPQEVARFYEEKFFEDIDALAVRRALKYPRASEHIPEMVALIKKLIKRGQAYLVRDGDGASVYYDLATFPKYGKLSGNTVRDLIAGARVETRQEKRNPYDFALWIYKPGHVLQWATPWGRGYPGWHLECSAMAMKYLGATLDIHTGGEDNKFPHHECEIAQSEGATGKRFVRMWLHVKHLLVEGKKMSKSQGNFYTLRDLLTKGHSARAVRYLLISTHYRDALNFTKDGLKAAESALTRIEELGQKLRDLPDKSLALGQTIKLSFVVLRARQEFIHAMDDDLNVSRALGVVFELVRKLNGLINTGLGIGADESRVAEKFLAEVDGVLGLGLQSRKKAVAPAEVRKLMDQREAARAAQDWARADELRDKIKKRGYAVEDTPQGPRVKKL